MRERPSKMRERPSHARAACAIIAASRVRPPRRRGTPMMNDTPAPFANPYLLLTLTALFWSGNMVIARGVHDAVPPMALAFWRWTIALVLVLLGKRLGRVEVLGVAFHLAGIALVFAGIFLTTRTTAD
jgi:hypothetical protein